MEASEDGFAAFAPHEILEMAQMKGYFGKKKAELKRHLKKLAKATGESTNGVAMEQTGEDEGEEDTLQIPHAEDCDCGSCGLQGECDALWVACDHCDT